MRAGAESRMLEGLSPKASEVAERFARFRTADNSRFYDALAEHMVGRADSPCLPMWFEYAITANQRGRETADRLQTLVPLRRGGLFQPRPRVLDVGCAYGGFLVAFAERGARVTGIEIDEALVRLALVNVREQAVDAEIVLGDATAVHPPFRGRFDLVIANDVLEHVPQPEAFLRNVRGWLSPRGVAYLQIPNGSFPAFVASDGHYQLFGVTLLEYSEASDYMRLDSGSPCTTYNYLDPAAYERLFVSCGLSFEILPEAAGSASVERVLEGCEELRSGLEEGLARVPEALRELVRERIEAYLRRVAAAPRGTPAEVRRFLLDYGSSFWSVLARRA
jgi:2-polyprenyl-3-methyl-5-hydroxy-6-metoxy-1,4-benzoquinol methylase